MEVIEVFALKRLLHHKIRKLLVLACHLTDNSILLCLCIIDLLNAKVMILITSIFILPRPKSRLRLCFPLPHPPQFYAHVPGAESNFVEMRLPGRADRRRHTRTNVLKDALNPEQLTHVRVLVLFC